MHCGSARCWAALRRLRARAVRVGGGAARIGRVLRDAAARGCSGVLVRLACWCTAVCSVLCCVFCCGGCAVLGAVPWGARTECWVWWSERSVSRWYSARDAECSGGSGAEHGQAGGARGFGLQNIQTVGCKIRCIAQRRSAKLVSSAYLRYLRWYLGIFSGFTSSAGADWYLRGIFASSADADWYLCGIFRRYQKIPHLFYTLFSHTPDLTTNQTSN